MTHIPTEAPYTDEYLNDQHKEFIKGWDLATEEIETFFANNEPETGIETIDKLLAEYHEKIKQEIVDWLKTTRQEHIVGLIDTYSDEELKERGWKD